MSRKRKFTYDCWNYDCDGSAIIIAKDECPNQEDVPAWIVQAYHLDPECLNPKCEVHLSASDVKKGHCKYQVRTDWENTDGEPCGGYVVEDYEPHTKDLYGKRKPGWFPVWIVRIGEWY
ncbi:MAG: hypothetical protein LBR72_08465 [Oscillospiraceae bacterium]|jgi:hypothetical protein|nr:hypothetical protein [Oscillospiraceae bacterium]